MTPEENRPPKTEQQPQTRRSVRLPGPEESVRSSEPRERRTPVPVRGSVTDRLLRVAELVVGDWAPTLRAAGLRVALFAAVLLAVGIAFGPAIVVLGLVVGFLMFLVGRRRAGAAG